MKFWLIALSAASCGGLGAAGDPWAGGVTQLGGIVGFDSGLQTASVTLATAYAGPKSTGPSGSATGQSGSATGSIAGIALTGTFDPSTGGLTLSGGGDSLGATADASGMIGVAESATGPGAFAAEPGTPTLLCGSYTGALSGTLGLVYNSTGQAIAVYDVGGAQSRGTLAGSIFGGTLDFKQPLTFNGHNLTLKGSADGNSAQGTWRDTDSTSGTWSATLCP